MISLYFLLIIEYNYIEYVVPFDKGVRTPHSFQRRSAWLAEPNPPKKLFF